MFTCSISHEQKPTCNKMIQNFGIFLKNVELKHWQRLDPFGLTLFDFNKMIFHSLIMLSFCVLIVGEEVICKNFVGILQIAILLDGNRRGARNQWYFFPQNRLIGGICALWRRDFGGRITERRVAGIYLEVEFHDIS